ncbi:uncharacterized protein BDW70DRAFT_156292 [Aspergillus foveolatus]|uniref:uncharacterized protein n=1 Tax=Aspergillus foveolatus TaxID=210207 RepID=UPI003CCE1694
MSDPSAPPATSTAFAAIDWAAMVIGSPRADGSAPNAATPAVSNSPVAAPVGTTTTHTYELDSDGDVLLVLHNSPFILPVCLEDLLSVHLNGRLLFTNTSLGTTFTGRTLRIKASSKHLTLAFPYFRRMLSSGFREGTELRNNGQVEIDTEEARTVPFLLLMLIVHSRTKHVPMAVSLEMLTDIAVLVDYYECYDAVEVFANLWIAGLEKDVPLCSTPVDNGAVSKKALSWLFISWVFRKKSIFERMTKFLLCYSKDKISDGGLPIPGAILEKLNQSRTDLITLILAALDKVHSNARQGCLLSISGYAFAPSQAETELCTYVVFGALTKQLMDKRLILPTPDPPYPGFSIVDLLAECRDIKSPHIGSFPSTTAHAKCSAGTRLRLALGRIFEPGGFDLDSEEFKQLRAGR